MRYINIPFKYHIYNFHFISFYFGVHVTSILKSWIDINYRIIRTYSKLQFLKQCKFRNIHPQHISNCAKTPVTVQNFKAIRKLNGVLHNFKTELLEIEIFDIYKLIRYLNNELSLLSQDMSSILPPAIWNSIKRHHSISFNNLKYRLNRNHQKKLNGLIKKTSNEKINKIKRIQYSYHTTRNRYSQNTYSDSSSKIQRVTNNINIDIDPKKFNIDEMSLLKHTKNKWFINLSNTTIPQEVSTLLQFGERFCLPLSNKKLAIHEFIKDIECNMTAHKIHNQVLIRNTAIPQFHKFLKNTPPKNIINENLLHLQHITQQFCRDNPNIIFTKADKGNITVALDKGHYISEIKDLLKDTNTYMMVKKNPIKSMERDLNNFLKVWLQKGYINKQQFFKLRSSDSLLPKAYGLPKIHKKNNPYRIIVSSINTALYSLATFLHKIISDSLEHRNSHTTNSFEVYNSLSGKTIRDTDVLLSLDVTALFTNVPLDLAIDGISHRWIYIQQYTKIPKNEFLMAINFVLSSTYFTFDNNIYKQVYGTPMGSPLSPIVADIVMQDLETQCINNFDFQFTFYFRYVDDVILAAPKDKIDIILKSFNNYHERLKFTVEYEKDRSLSFLDLLITVSNNSIYIDWFHKETFSGRFLSFYSSHPWCHKIGTMYGLIDRAFLLSHPRFHQKNLKLVINLLLDNGYPLELIFEKMNARIKSLINKKDPGMGSSRKTHDDSNNNKKFVVFPYIEGISELISSTVDKTKYITGYRVLNSLGRFIKVHKDTNNLLSNNNVVYKISCSDCNASYVGQTKRQLKTRLKEHSNNIKSDTSKHSVITQHILEYSHTFDWNNTKILDTECNFYKRSISEMLHIKEQENGINAQTDTELLDIAYFDILDQLSKL